MAAGAAGANPGQDSMSLDAQTCKNVSEAVADLDRWLDSIHNPGGYGCPVAHWWGDCLEFTGPRLGNAHSG